MVKIKKSKKDNFIKKPEITRENDELFLISLKHLDKTQ
jgi:hypothetical protein